jgi:hypothetical protein
LLKNRDIALYKYISALEARDSARRDLERTQASLQQPKKSGLDALREKLSSDGPAERVKKAEVKLEDVSQRGGGVMGFGCGLSFPQKCFSQLTFFYDVAVQIL